MASEALAILSGHLAQDFLAVFPDAILVRYGRYTYLIGYRDGTPSDLSKRVGAACARGERQFSTSKIKTPEQMLRAIHIPKPEALRDFPINRDDFPVVEYSFRGFEFSASSEAILPLKRYTRPYSAR